jgi:hypothetical protein
VCTLEHSVTPASLPRRGTVLWRSFVTSCPLSATPPPPPPPPPPLSDRERERERERERGGGRELFHAESSDA